MVEGVSYSEDDDEYDIRRKEQEYEERMREAEDEERKAYETHEQLKKMKKEIAKLFQQSIYDLFGVLYKEENIEFSDDPDFTYERPSLIERVGGAVGTAQAFVNDYAERHNFKK